MALNPIVYTEKVVRERIMIDIFLHEVLRLGYLSHDESGGVTYAVGPALVLYDPIACLRQDLTLHRGLVLQAAVAGKAG